ncbi:MAG TPA: MaoC family dehydratase N-terminal domain-containing protein [Dehalococcoidia bacterium]|nr:MaoC family dehydratase N-terminal domain-containing protein [Dehalococcoidia bacterium]|tara:strand:- start:307 stop:780 length:474 start_codon:yes stop_codon:yes gene_type:complete
MAESVVSDEMRAAVGVETPGAVSEVTTSGIRMFARAVGYTDLIFYDEDAAKAQGHRGLVAPPGYLGTPIYRPASAGPSSPARVQFKTPYKRVLNGGTSYEYVAPVIAGDVITSASKITEFREREGSRGRMLITYRETTFTNQDNVVVARMRGNGIQY